MRSFTGNSNYFFAHLDNRSLPESSTSSETWTLIQDIPGYISFLTIRETARSGGICINDKGSFFATKVEELSFSAWLDYSPTDNSPKLALEG